VAVSLPQIGNVPLAEVWTADLPHEVNQFENISYAANSDLVFGSIKFHESQTDGLEQLAFRAYKEILNFLDRKRFPVLVRCWNYFPKINLETNGIERYKLFCAGRGDAFAEKYKSMHRYLPAGSAVGSASGPLTINFLATRNHSVKHIENPRQVSAYLYPREYGKCSPSFARATCMDWRENQYLYVAGTASIVGHKSYHKDDPLQQIHEIHRNLESLLDHCGFILDRGDENVAPENVLITKTYIRDAELLPLVREKMEKRLGGGQSSLYLVGDICRKELLLEVEGVFLKNSSAHVSGKNIIPRR
jgi:chorismate lyase/3-hydroxybenzoate synthase